MSHKHEHTQNQPDQERRYTAPNFGDKETAQFKVGGEFVDDSPTIPYDVKRIRKVIGSNAISQAPASEAWRWQGEAPPRVPSNPGPNRNTGAKGLHPDRR